MLYFVIVFIQAIIFGFATKAVVENKGYDENWFWWGFFFGLIAFVIACAKPQNIDYFYFMNQSSQPAQTGYAERQSVNNKNYNGKLLSGGEWKCGCGRVHAPYVSSCTCGVNKSEIITAEQEIKQESAQAEHTETAQIMDEISKAAAIKKYKELMDFNIITPEEFEAKKKQLLDI